MYIKLVVLMHILLFLILKDFWVAGITYVTVFN